MSSSFSSDRASTAVLRASLPLRDPVSRSRCLHHLLAVCLPRRKILTTSSAGSNELFTVKRSTLVIPDESRPRNWWWRLTCLLYLVDLANWLQIRPPQFSSRSTSPLLYRIRLYELVRGLWNTIHSRRFTTLWNWLLAKVALSVSRGTGAWKCIVEDGCEPVRVNRRRQQPWHRLSSADLHPSPRSGGSGGRHRAVVILVAVTPPSSTWQYSINPSLSPLILSILIENSSVCF